MSNLYDKILFGDIKTIFFPADFDISDIYSFALLTMINRGLSFDFVDKAKAKDLKGNDDVLLIDIGNSEFNSNSAFFDVDESGKKLSAFGKLWKELGESIMGYKELADTVNKNLINNIESNYDAEDNCNVSHVILSMMPDWNESMDDELIHSRFLQAAQLVELFLSFAIKKFDSMDKAQDIVESEIEENGHEHVLYFNQWNPAIQFIPQYNKFEENADKQIYFAVYPESEEELAVESFPDYNDKVLTVDKSKMTLPKDELLQYLKSLV